MQRPSSNTASALLVAALHALLLLGAWRLQAWQDRGPPPPRQAPLTVWLQAAPRPNLAPSRAAAPARLPLAAAPSRPVPTLTGPEPQAITLPAPVPDSVPIPAPIAAEATSTAPPHAPAPAARLNLSLPRAASAPWRARHPALDDPRSNSAQATLESRIAAVLGGSDQITEYRLEDGSVRMRRGQACVVVRPNRDATLNPFNSSVQQRPRLVDRC